MWLVVGCQSSRSDELPRCVRKIERTGDHALIDSNPALASAVRYLADQQILAGHGCWRSSRGILFSLLFTILQPEPGRAELFHADTHPRSV